MGFLIRYVGQWNFELVCEGGLRKACTAFFMFLVRRFQNGLWGVSLGGYTVGHIKIGVRMCMCGYIILRVRMYMHIQIETYTDMYLLRTVWLYWCCSGLVHAGPKHNLNCSPQIDPKPQPLTSPTSILKSLNLQAQPYNPCFRPSQKVWNPQKPLTPRNLKPKALIIIHATPLNRENLPKPENTSSPKGLGFRV